MTSSRNRAASRQPHPRMGGTSFRRRWRGRRAGRTGSRRAGHRRPSSWTSASSRARMGRWSFLPSRSTPARAWRCSSPAGRALLLARPGRPGLSGPPGRRPGHGPPQAVPQGRGACGAPLTRAAARWQPVQQATGRSARGRRVPACGAAGEAGPCPQPPWWASLQLPAGRWWPGPADGQAPTRGAADRDRSPLAGRLTAGGAAGGRWGSSAARTCGS
jgi:hypothetical protein